MALPAGAIPPLTAMRVLFIYPPLRNQPDRFLPMGCLVLAEALAGAGHEVGILNLDRKRLADDEAVARVRAFTPDLIGWSAVTGTTYATVKRLSRRFRQEFPGCWQVLGGNLAAAAETLLTQCALDLVFVGAADVSLVRAGERFPRPAAAGRRLPELADIGGLVFRAGDLWVSTGPAEQRVGPLPRNLSLIDREFYLPRIREAGFAAIGNERLRALAAAGRRQIDMLLRRGCRNACSFCHRNYRGSEDRPVAEVVDYLRWLRDTQEIGFVRGLGESFLDDRQWALDFARAAAPLGLAFEIGGARADQADAEVLTALRAAGSVGVFFGYESGSQAMLDAMDKRTTVADNRRAARLVRELGLHSPAQIVIGMPGETVATLAETAAFLREIGPLTLSVNFAQAYPGSLLYHDAVVRGLVPDEDRYLESISGRDANDPAARCRSADFPEEMLLLHIRLLRVAARRWPLGELGYRLARVATRCRWLAWYLIVRRPGWRALRLALRLALFDRIEPQTGACYPGGSLREQLRPRVAGLSPLDRIRFGW